MKKTRTHFNILVINPGSTSTKLALYRNHSAVIFKTISYSSARLRKFPSIISQLPMRLEGVEKFLKAQGKISLDAIAARGGVLRPLAGGVYKVNDKMCGELSKALHGEHGSNLGALIAHKLSQSKSCPAYIADPVVVDEMKDVARISGMPGIERKSLFHALNQKSVARLALKRLGKEYEKCNVIVAHLGGGISVGAHKKGQVVDVNNALDGDGPFSPERTGGLPAGQLAALIYKEGLDEAALKRKLSGQGGVVAYCGTNNMATIEVKRKQGNKKSQLLTRALAYQVSQEIAKHGATLQGKVDRIVITGGLAKDKEIVSKIKRQVSFLASISVIPGEREMPALAENILAVLKKEKRAKVYL
ncbi:MAG: butyrate kinase [Fibrobacteria bacterium]|nr:butyrate kinase [Fibrobacteria bacterium]